MYIKFCTVDVFTEQVFGGAQIAVVCDADNLNDKQMQAIAAEFSVSDTVFIRTLDAKQNRFSLRIFTPGKETGFGSHTTVAAVYGLAHAGLLNLTDKHTPLWFEHRGRELHLHVSHNQGEIELVQLSWVTQPIVDNYVPSTAELAELLSLPQKMLDVKSFRPLLVSNNGIYIVVPVRGLEAIKAAQFNSKAWHQSLAAHTSAQQLLVFSQQCETAGADFHLKLFSPNLGPQQDPPVGAAIPAFGAFLCAHPHIKPGTYSFIAERGLQSARQSLLHVELDNQSKEDLTLRVGGKAIVVSEGTMKL